MSKGVIEQLPKDSIERKMLENDYEAWKFICTSRMIFQKDKEVWDESLEIDKLMGKNFDLVRKKYGIK